MLQETQRAWLGNMGATPCTRCWVTSVWWDSWGFTHCLVIITRPSKSWRTLSSTRRYGLNAALMHFLASHLILSCISLFFFCLVHTHESVFVSCLPEYVLSCPRVPDHYLLLCRFRLLDDETLPGCHSSLCQYPALHPEDKKHVPEVNIQIWDGQS